MIAALVRTLGEPPRPAEVEQPVRGAGEALLEVGAAPINPIDLSMGSGTFYGGAPDVPYVPGRECVGRVLEGERFPPGARVYATPRRGAFAQRVAAAEDDLVEVPEGTSDAVAASLGIAGLAAWLPVEWRGELQPGETVLVLGASGAVGQVAVQAARLLGAGRVVAAARSEAGRARARELGADAAVDLGGGGDLVAAIREAAEGDVDLTIDPLWGRPAEAAIAASGAHARLVQIGQSAGGEATLPSAHIRGRPVAVLGHTNFAVPREVRDAAYRTMIGHAAAGRLTVDREVVPLEQVTQAWERQGAHPGRKLVLQP